MKEKNYSIELIRVIAMLMIVVLHMNMFCLGVVRSMDTKNIVFTITEFICIIAVNLYVLISGYFLEKSRFNLKKIINLELIVVFYSVIVYLFLVIFGFNTFSIKTLIKMFFPVINSSYWFYTCYFVMYLFMPLFKKTYEYLKGINKEKIFLIILIIITSLIPTINPLNNPLKLSSGYSYVWFVTLLFTGAYIHDNPIKLNKLKTFIVYLVILGIELIIYYPLSKISLLDNIRGFLFGYNNIFVFINSILIFNLISKININKDITKKIISFFSISTFSVYLIHTHPLLISPILRGVLNLAKYNIDSRVYIYYILYTLGVFFGCILLDKVRLFIFNIFGKFKYNKSLDEKIEIVNNKIKIE